MSAKKAEALDAPVEEVNTEPAAKPEPQCVWLPSGLPCFVGDTDDVVDQVKEMGFSIFYVLGSRRNAHTYQTQSGSTVTDHTDDPRIFRVTQNFIGHAIIEVSDDKLDLATVKPVAFFELPKIPFEMVQKLDYFFREVDRRHGTEAIVLLTYDPRVDETKKDPAGWGVLVPKQENTAGHCKYDPETVIDDKDDEVLIVGTAHSHPNMSAFASHTDHNDQMGNDGIHITFGWGRGKNQTEHHIELQMGGGSFTMEPEQAFSDAPEPPMFPEEVKPWVDKVQKKESPPFRGGPMGSLTSHSSTPIGGGSSSFRGGTHLDANQKPFDLPEGCPDPREATVVVRLLNDSEKRCPVCDSFLRNDAVKRRRCWDCLCFFLVGPDENVEDVVNMRMGSADMPCYEIRTDKAVKPIKIWNVAVEGGEEKRSVEDYYTPKD